ncbi:MAG: lipopolysaccharide biosynthesis protein [Actinomycetia bacterium]|nr:lipopolysaccharide biosynthesis protein [Actinomycetes bacterium]
MDASTGSSAPVVAAADLRAALRQRWWLVVIVTLAGVALAAVAIRVIPQTYQATTTVLVQAAGADSSSSSGGTGTKNAVINLDTESQIVPSAAVAERVRGLLKTPTSASDLADMITVEIVPNATVLAINAVASTPIDAQRISRTFAKAYLDQREEAAKADIAARTKLLTDRLTDANKQLQAVAGQVAALAANSPDRAYADAQKQVLTNKVQNLTSQLSDLQALTVTPGRVLNDAALPTDPQQPPPYLLLLAGLVFGLIAGAGLALLLARLDRRLRRPADIFALGDVPLLGSVPPGRPAARGTSLPAIAPSMTPVGQAFGQIRNDVTTALPRRPASLLVAGTEAGTANSLVAANLAVAMARSGAAVLLVCADLHGSTAERMLGLEGLTRSEGLAEALSGKAEPLTLLRAAPVVPGLWVLGVGRAGDAAAELLQSRQLEWVLSAVRGESFVILEAPPTSSGAEAQAMARLCDAAILVSEVGRSKLDDIDDGAHQLARVGTRLLGSVVAERQATPSRKRKGGHTRTTPIAPPVDAASRLAGAGLGENTVAITPDQLSALRSGQAPQSSRASLRGGGGEGSIDGLSSQPEPAAVEESATYSSTVYRFTSDDDDPPSHLPDALDPLPDPPVNGSLNGHGLFARTEVLAVPGVSLADESVPAGDLDGFPAGDADGVGDEAAEDDTTTVLATPDERAEVSTVADSGEDGDGEAYSDYTDGEGETYGDAGDLPAVPVRGAAEVPAPRSGDSGQYGSAQYRAAEYGSAQYGGTEHGAAGYGGAGEPGPGDEPDADPGDGELQRGELGDGELGDGDADEDTVAQPATSDDDTVATPAAGGATPARR